MPEETAEVFAAKLYHLLPGLERHLRYLRVNPHDAEEIVADAWLLTTLHRHAIEEDASLYLKRVLTSVLVSHKRAEKAKKRGGAVAIGSLDRSPPADQETPSTPVSRFDDAAFLWHVISQLDGPQCAAIQLFYVGEMTTEAVADYLGITKYAAKLLKQKALRKLKLLLTERESR